MSLSDFTNALDVIRQYGMEVLQLFITLIVVLIIVGTIASSTLTGPDTEPPVLFPDHPRSDETGCTRIDGIEICPRSTSLSAAQLAPHGQPLRLLSADEHLASALPFWRKGEKRGKPSPEAVRAVELVAEVLQIDRDFKVYSATFEQSPIAYVRFSIFRAEIVYDRAYFQMDNAEQKMTWMFAFIMGHEAGHTQNYKPNNNDPWGSEASADYLGAMAVYRLGGDLRDALDVTALFSEFGSPSHPARIFRREAIRQGWTQARDRHLNPSNRCKRAFIGPTISLEKQVCKMAVTCLDEGKPIQTACKGEAGTWSWL